MDANEYLQSLEDEWNYMANKNANGKLVVPSDLDRFVDLKEMRKRLAKKWQK